MRTTVMTLATITAALLFVVAGPATAHVMLMPGDVEPGDTLDTELLVVHGCGPGGTIPATDEDASPTVSVALEVPAPIQITAHDVDGWSVSTERGSADEATHILWENEDRSGTTDPSYLGVTSAPDEPGQGLSAVAIALIATLIAVLAGAVSFLITGRGSS